MARRRATMPSEVWRALVRKYIVYDVPDEMAACFDCHVVHCSNSKYETCSERLANAAALGATRISERSAANCAAAGCR
jgi:hypothetical protein